MNDNKSRDIFYGVVAIATLIVAIVGATLAYFSISAGSNEGAVAAKAKVVSINYNDQQQVIAQAENLIPSELKIMQYFYERALASAPTPTSEGAHETIKCQDAKDEEICSVYRFSVSIDSGEESITAMLRTEDNAFNYLAYAVREVSCTPRKTVDVTESDDTSTSYETFSADDDYTSCWLPLDGSTKSLGVARCSNKDQTDSLNPALPCYTEDETTHARTYSLSNPNTMNSIFGYDSENKANLQTISGTTKVYDVVLFLAENRGNQNEDQGKEFKGTLVVEVSGKESIITGRATNNNQP